MGGGVDLSHDSVSARHGVRVDGNSSDLGSRTPKCRLSSAYLNCETNKFKNKLYGSLEGAEMLDVNTTI